MDGVIIILIASVSISSLMFICLQGNILRRHRENNYRFHRNNMRFYNNN
jgi:hypothetical protein